MYQGKVDSGSTRSLTQSLLKPYHLEMKVGVCVNPKRCILEMELDLTQDIVLHCLELLFLGQTLSWNFWQRLE